MLPVAAAVRDPLVVSQMKFQRQVEMQAEEAITREGEGQEKGAHRGKAVP